MPSKQGPILWPRRTPLWPRPPTIRWWVSFRSVCCRSSDSGRSRNKLPRSTSWTPLIAAELANIPDGNAKTRGIVIGHLAAEAILSRRALDGATTFVSYTPGTNPGDWQPTPNPIPFDPPAAADRLPAVLPGWGQVTPFVLRSSDQFQTDGPPALTSDQYTRDFAEVRAVGAKTSVERTPNQHGYRAVLVRRVAGWMESASPAWLPMRVAWTSGSAHVSLRS